MSHNISAKLETCCSSVINIKGRAGEVVQEPCRRVCSSSRQEKALGLCVVEKEDEGGTLHLLVLLP